VVGQERLDAPLGHELAAQRCRVEELTIWVAIALHPPILADRASKRESCDHGFNQTVS